MPRPRLALALPALVAAFAALAPASGRGSPDGVVLVAWKDLDPGELRSVYLDLERPIELGVKATATRSETDRTLLAYPWILDSETRDVVWTVDPARARPAARARRERGTQLVADETTLPLPAGHYEVYYTTWGSAYRMRVASWLGIRFGRRKTESTPGMERDAWRFELTCRPEDAAAATAGERARPTFNPLLRIAHPGNDELERVPFRLDAPAAVGIYAIGEYDASTGSMADLGWIMRADNRERVWEMTVDNTRLAGGADKNRLFRSAVRLEAGTYLLCYSTDDSHAYGAWNVNPPDDPEFWGIALFDHDGARAHFSPEVEDPYAANLIVALDHQPSNTFNRKGIRVRKPIRVRVIALGEYAEGEHRFVDFGWIEEARVHRVVWHMTPDNTRPAGGARKNRMANEVITLPRGDYVICSWTDDSHAYGDWNAPPPHEPEAWGIQVWGTDPSFDRAQVEDYDEDHDPRVLAQLLGIGDGRHAFERFEVKERVKARILALGEGTGGQMFDYGWLRRVDGPKATVLWRMRYADTTPAGGNAKNRREEQILELEPGSYELHYVTDDSHSFEDWNAEPPDQPHLWGAALYRAD